MKPFFVYMLWCADGTIYVGHTDDLERRLEQHAVGGHDGYTAARRPVELAFASECETRLDALTYERKLKGWSHPKKAALIRGDWAQIRALARSHDGPRRGGAAHTPHAAHGSPGRQAGRGG